MIFLISSSANIPIQEATSAETAADGFHKAHLLQHRNKMVLI